MPLSEHNWNKILELYGNLIYSIAHKITLDPALCQYEDNVQDLQLAALRAIKGFAKQKESNGNPDDFIGTVGFGKYLKTCLWNYKNKKGNDATKYSKLFQEMPYFTDKFLTSGARLYSDVPLTDLVSDDKFDKEFSETLPFLLDCESFSEVEITIINIIVNDTQSLLENGRVNIAYVSKKSGIYLEKLERILEKLQRKHYAEIMRK